jgi:hypothetical protein
MKINTRDYIKGQNNRESGHSEFISESDRKCVNILK